MIQIWRMGVRRRSICNGQLRESSGERGRFVLVFAEAFSSVHLALSPFRLVSTKARQELSLLGLGIVVGSSGFWPDVYIIVP